jgi:CDP-diacylglycerol--glycerol-3-phosphate 3-phosphatidyltransferase
MGLTLANKITIGRFIAIPVLVALLLYYSPEREYIRWLALGLYLVAEITDVIDGYIARNYRQKTKAGSILDPLADKLLFLSTLLCLYQVSTNYQWPVRIPLWLVLAFFTRDAILIIGGFLLEMKRGLIEIRPNQWGKLTAFLQVVCLTAVFIDLPLTPVILYVALAATVISGIIYMKEGIKVLNDGHH